MTSSQSDFLVTFDLGDSAKFGALPTVSLNRNLASAPGTTNYEIQASNDPNAWVGVTGVQAVCN